LRVPLASFSDGRERAPRESYRALPAAGGHALRNRFISDYLIYGTGERAIAMRYATAEIAQEVPLEHRVERIEALGRDAVLVGSDGKDLHFTSLRLGRVPSVAGRYVRPNASQGEGETRNHGFFYNAAQDLIGLPVIGPANAVLYLRNRNLSLVEAGTLDSRPAGGNDACRASCVDWYGDSRPLFLRGRVFALMGYEIVEGELRGERVRELRRASFAPAVALRAD
jgi:hypothetical protein